MNRSIGMYEIRGIAGRGAMGTVYDAWDSASDRRVAVKTISLAAADADTVGQQRLRFEREAEIAGGLVHPNIVRVFDSGQTADEAFLVMEFVEGQSLKELLEAGTRFTAAESLAIMHSTLSALEYSHVCGVVHRDIKPANLMITLDGTVKLADFGIARIEGSSMTQTGVMVGTPAYMSPEQFLGDPVDARSDVYSAGALLFQLLTGERPFEGGMASIIYKALHTTLPKPSGLSIQAPPALDAVVARAMARNPNDRYPSALAFDNALDDAMSQATVVAPISVMAPVLPPETKMSTANEVYKHAATPGASRNLSQIPAYVAPTVLPERHESGSGGLLRVLIFLAVLAGASVVGFDLFTKQPIGTLPRMQDFAPLPAHPDGVRYR